MPVFESGWELCCYIWIPIVLVYVIPSSSLWKLLTFAQVTLNQPAYEFPYVNQNAREVLRSEVAETVIGMTRKIVEDILLLSPHKRAK